MAIMKPKLFSITDELDEKLIEMASDDERSQSAFIRILIRREWERRNSQSLSGFDTTAFADQVVEIVEESN